MRIPLIEKVCEKIVDQDIVSVQPVGAPLGKLFYTDYNYEGGTPPIEESPWHYKYDMFDMLVFNETTPKVKVGYGYEETGIPFDVPYKHIENSLFVFYVDNDGNVRVYKSPWKDHHMDSINSPEILDRMENELSMGTEWIERYLNSLNNKDILDM